MNGLLVIDKAGGMTSRDVVNRVQRWTPRKTKVGHTGTLDPLATGVLVVCVGAATRLAGYVQAMGKTYRSRFRLGATSTTDDADGRVTPNPAAAPPTRAAVDAAVQEFIGCVEQVPPAFSALKVDGRRAYSVARAGGDVELAVRVVRIDAIRVLTYDWPFLDVEVDCGKGTYIRSIARDLGTKLGVGGLVETLRRTRVGPFTAEQGVGVDVPPGEGRARLLPMVMAVEGMEQVCLGPDDARRLFHGQAVRIAPQPGPGASPATVAVMSPGMELLAIGEVNGAGGLRPVMVLANAEA